MMQFRSWWLAAFSFLLAMGFVRGPVALAYVPPSAFLVKSLATKHVGPKGVRVRSKLTLGAKPTEGSASVAPEASIKVTTIYYSETGKVRSLVTDEAGQLLYSQEHTLQPEDRNASSRVVPHALLFDSHLNRLTKVLVAFGLPIRSEAELLAMKDEEARRASEVLSLSRWNRVPTWVMGWDGKESSSSTPQLWMEKDSFVPIRLISGSHEIRFEEYRQYGGFSYPRLISALEDGKVIYHEGLTDLLLNPPELKDPKKLTTVGFTEAGEAAPGLVRDLIRKCFESGR